MTTEREIFLQTAECVAGSLRDKLTATPEVVSVAFYGTPTPGTDLDVLIVAEDKSALDSVRVSLQELSNQYRTKIDAWLLSPEQLELRMKRIAYGSKGKPKIIEKMTEWENFGFFPITGQEYLTSTINDCYSKPEPGGPIPPTDEEKCIFSPV